MNRQVRYIVYAFLYIVIIAITLNFVRAFLRNPDSPSNDFLTTTSAPDNAGAAGSPAARKGKTIFTGKCASCHSLFKDLTGPGLAGFTERGPWTDRKNIYDWIRNPAAFMAKNEYARALKNKYGSMMQGFPDLTNEEMDAIVEYIREYESAKDGPVARR